MFADDGSQTKADGPSPQAPLQQQAAVALAGLVLAHDDEDMTSIDIDKLKTGRVMEMSAFLLAAFIQLLFDGPWPQQPKELIAALLKARSASSKIAYTLARNILITTGCHDGLAEETKPTILKIGPLRALLSGLIAAAAEAPLKSKMAEVVLQVEADVSDDLYTEMEKRVQTRHNEIRVATTALAQICDAARTPGQTAPRELADSIRLVAVLLALAHPVAAQITASLITKKNEETFPSLIKCWFGQGKEDETLFQQSLRAFIRRQMFSPVDLQTLYHRHFQYVIEYFGYDYGRADTSYTWTLSKYVDMVASLPPCLWKALFLSFYHDDFKVRRSESQLQLLSILGTWLGLASLFENNPRLEGLQPILISHHDDGQGRNQGVRPASASLDVSIEELLNRSKCLPRKSKWKLPEEDLAVDDLLGQLESTKIDGESLNLLTLQKYTKVKIEWVDNVARHLILSQRTGRDVLEVYAFPRILEISSQRPISSKHPFYEYQQEVLCTYGLLFPVWKGSRKLEKIIKDGRIQDVQSIRRIANVVTEENPGNWNTSELGTLWPRIVKLKDYQDQAQPASWWAVWRDRRDPVKYYGTL